MQDLGNWEELRRVPEHFQLPQDEQWIKVGSYLCIQHVGYYGEKQSRCWQRSYLRCGITDMRTSQRFAR
jgi:hypothetical protein